MAFDKLGYIRMDNNVKTGHKAREYRRVFVNANCVFVKIVLHKNFVNKYNAFNQVGLFYMEFIGEKQPQNFKPNFSKIEYTAESAKLEILDELVIERVKILTAIQEDAIKQEDYDEAKKAKLHIDKTIVIGKRIYKLVAEKKLSIDNQDFDNAKYLKSEIESLKNKLRPPTLEKSSTKISITNLSLTANNNNVSVSEIKGNENEKENKAANNISMETMVIGEIKEK